MTTGQIMQAIRKERGYTQKQLAEKCGLATGTIQQYELNKREPRREQLQKIATVLDVPLYELMGFDGSIRVKITPEQIERSRIENKLLTDSENVTREELKLLNNYYHSEQFKNSFIQLKEGIHENLKILERLQTAYEALNENGQEKVAEHAEMIAKIPEYQKENTPPQS